MYRLRSERALLVRRKLRFLAFFVFLLGVSVVVSGLFIYSLAMTERSIAAKEERIEAANLELMQSLGGGTDAVSNDELSLIRMRRVQLKWSDILATLARTMPDEMWLTNIELNSGALVGRRARTGGFRIEGRIKSGGRQESLNRLMGFIDAVQEKEVFSESFAEVTLVNSKWEESRDEDYLEFQILCITE
jgi:Tfp pilus assembly protein PilN